MDEHDPLPPSEEDDGLPPFAQASEVEPAAGDAIAPLLVGRSVNFCSRCGTKFAPDWLECMHCASRTLPAQAAEATPTQTPLEDDIRPVKSAIGLYFSLLAISLVMTIYLLASRNREVGPTAEFVATGLFTVVTLGWAINFRQALTPLLRRVGPWWVYVAAPVFGACTFVVASLIVAGLRVYLHVPTIGYTDSYDAAGYGFGLAILMIAVQPAVIEELAFRGVMTSALDRVLTAREASIVVAFLFGILHLSVPSLAHLTLLGLLLAWLRRRAGSLYPCMLMHFTHNLLVLLDERYGWTPW